MSTDTKNNNTGDDVCDFGGPVHPFAGAHYAKFAEGKPTTFALVERKPMSTFWKKEGMGENMPWTKDKQAGEAAGWPQHDVFAAVVANSDGSFTRARVDVKSRLRFAFRALPVKRGVWYTLARSGSGKQTEYAISACEKVSKAMTGCIDDAKAVCGNVAV